MSTSTLSARHVISRIGAGVLGGYAFVWGFIALGIAGLYALDVPFHDAEAVSNILGFLLFLTVFLWAFAARSVNRVWLVLVGGGLLMTGIATLIEQSLV
ncbi:MAG: iron uptake protein [Cellvibrio sp. 79]|nr:MAG: iron uptake protein [Cellvibrio sp. 79]